MHSDQFQNLKSGTLLKTIMPRVPNYPLHAFWDGRYIDITGGRVVMFLGLREANMPGKRHKLFFPMILTEKGTYFILPYFLEEI